MSIFEIYFISVFIINASLGIGVFFTNHKRTVNQLYLSLSVIVAIWLTSNWLILHADEEAIATLFVKLATAVAILIPATCHILRLAIFYPMDNWLQILCKAKRLLSGCSVIMLLCFTPFLIDSVKMPSNEAFSPEVPEAVYNWGYFVFAAIFIGLVISLLLTFSRDRKRVEGLQRIELDFITIGYCTALVTGTLCGVMVTIFTGSSQTVPMANATSILALSTIISYGIATKRILGIATVLRRITAYSILISYLVGLYFLVSHILNYLLGELRVESTFLAQLLATLAVALSMTPAHGKFQKISDKLIASKSLNISDAMKKAGDVFQSVTTINSLLDHFSLLLKSSLGSDHVLILTATPSGFLQSYPKAGPSNPVQLTQLPAIVRLIKKEKEPVCGDNLVRTRETVESKAMIQELENHDASIAIGIFSKSNLTGLVLLGNRLDGRIYDHNEQDALQILCNQFAVALDNAQMYTEMQDSKIRNEILLDQLVSGVIVADTDRQISLINHEAQRVTGLSETKAIGSEIDLLPASISRIMDKTLAKKTGQRNVDAVLFSQEEESTHVRMGSAYLLGHDDKPMGALLVFTDMTELKKLEEQVRRSDQLSSVGTLAAGMAHEIKNPLVTIKTFSQLLPERYGDADFRHDFSSLVMHEVSRIDGIVNQLLSFSKPTKPHLESMKLHDTIGQTLKLIHEQLSQKNIVLSNNFNATQDLISGDADLLTQALVNLNLNAIDAIDKNGEISVGTTNCSYRFVQGNGHERAAPTSCIRLQISDTGVGIPNDKLKKIFDPFFTSKSEGTGMGLSVAHGIIQEHRGAIEVESEPGKGTTFYIYLPVIKEDPVA